MRVRFTEQMRGFHTPGSPAYDAGYVNGQRNWNRLSFELTIAAADVTAMLHDIDHRMVATGYVRCRELHSADMPVRDGDFELFVPGSAPGRLQMRYRLPLQTLQGPMTLLGYKDVGNDRGLDAWPDTTTLFTRVVRGNADFDAPVTQEYSRGILRLNPVMFCRQLSTFRGTPSGVANFGLYFLRQLAGVYARPPRKDVLR
jgi:hypothetical protein